ADRSPAGDAAARRARRMGRDRPRGPQGQADTLRPCAARDRRRRAGPRVRRGLGVRRGTDRGAPWWSRLMPKDDPASGFLIEPPMEPMLAKPARELPTGDGWLFEPKWDGFRAIVFRDRDRLYTQSRDLKPLQRYFPELQDLFRASLPERCVVDGEIVI